MASCSVDLSAAAVEDENQRALLKELLDKNACVFSQTPLDYGRTTTIQHEIPLVDSRPFRLPYRKIAPSQWQDVRQLLTEMEQQESSALVRVRMPLQWSCDQGKMGH